MDARITHKLVDSVLVTAIGLGLRIIEERGSKVKDSSASIRMRNLEQKRESWQEKGDKVTYRLELKDGTHFSVDLTGPNHPEVEDEADKK